MTRTLVTSAVDVAGVMARAVRIAKRDASSPVSAEVAALLDATGEDMVNDGAYEVRIDGKVELRTRGAEFHDPTYAAALTLARRLLVLHQVDDLRGARRG